MASVVVQPGADERDRAGRDVADPDCRSSSARTSRASPPVRSWQACRRIATRAWSFPSTTGTPPPAPPALIDVPHPLIGLAQLPVSDPVVRLDEQRFARVARPPGHRARRRQSEPTCCGPKHPGDRSRGIAAPPRALLRGAPAARSRARAASGSARSPGRAQWHAEARLGRRPVPVEQELNSRDRGVRLGDALAVFQRTLRRLPRGFRDRMVSCRWQRDGRSTCQRSRPRRARTSDRASWPAESSRAPARPSPASSGCSSGAREDTDRTLRGSASGGGDRDRALRRKAQWICRAMARPRSA